MNEKLLGLQVARGIAALSVVIFHAKLILIRFPEESYVKLPYFYSHGDIGVPFFFVISGFIISYVIDKPSHSLSSFAVKRVFRLWPTYFFCTILYLAIYLLHRTLPANEIGYSFSYVIKSIFFWPMGNLPALHPGWSLEHEVLFYVFAAIAAKIYGVKGLFYSLLALVVVSVVLRVILPSLNGFNMFWDYHVFAPINTCFLFGVGLYLFWKKYSHFLSGGRSKVWVVSGFILIILSPYLIETIPNLLENNRANKDLIKGYLRFVVESLASVVLLFGLIGLAVTNVFSRALASIGDRSYSLYLCHFMFVPIFQNIHREYVAWPQSFAEFLCIAFVMVSLGTAYIMYWSVEKPSSSYGSVFAAKLKLRKATTITH